MSEVKRYEAGHVRYEESNIRYGEGCEVEVVTARDYDTLAAENKRLHKLIDVANSFQDALENERDQLRAELAALKGEQGAVATILPPDPYDERDGIWISAEDLRAIAALPAGTKLYTSPAPQQPGQDVARLDVNKMARALCNRHADACGVDREDQWKFYSQDFIDDAQCMIDAAHDKQSGGAA